MKTRDIDIGDLSTLNNICLVAAERFAENAALWRRQAEQDVPPESALTLAPHGPAAMRLAEQFERQAVEARSFAALFASADPFRVRLDR